MSAGNSDDGRLANEPEIGRPCGEAEPTRVWFCCHVWDSLVLIISAQQPWSDPPSNAQQSRLLTLIAKELNVTTMTSERPTPVPLSNARTDRCPDWGVRLGGRLVRVKTSVHHHPVRSYQERTANES